MELATGVPIPAPSRTGASMMWAFPGWKYVFYPFRGRLRPQRIARNVILRSADRIGRAFPTVSDFVVTTWRKP